MEITTKDRILDEALKSFAENGYNGTNLRDLASNLGLSKSALYKHYNSKEDIWNAMIDRIRNYYNANFDHHPRIPETCEELLELTMQLIGFTIHDPQIILTRRLLMTEQFRGGRASELATEYFLNGTKRMFSEIFRNMIEDGLLKQDDPELLALAYTAPITVLIHQCDRERDRESEITKQIQAFARHFIETYRADSEK